MYIIVPDIIDIMNIFLEVFGEQHHVDASILFAPICNMEVKDYLRGCMQLLFNFDW